VIFYDHFVHFALIWYISPGLGNIYKEKSGNPNVEKSRTADVGTLLWIIWLCTLTRVTRLGKFSHIGQLFTLSRFFKLQNKPSLWTTFFPFKLHVFHSTKKFWAQFWVSFSQTHLVTLTLTYLTLECIFSNSVLTNVSCTHIFMYILCVINFHLEPILRPLVAETAL
jgi:hypothetical protein